MIFFHGLTSHKNVFQVKPGSEAIGDEYQAPAGLRAAGFQPDMDDDDRVDPSKFKDPTNKVWPLTQFFYCFIFVNNHSFAWRANQ